MQPIPTLPTWAPALAMRLVPLGTRTVVRKQNGAVYTYKYLRFDTGLFPEVVGARRIRLVIAPPDFAAPPIIVTARLFQKGKRVWGFVIDAAYQRVVTNYARNDHLGVIAVEVMEAERPRHEKEAKTPEAL